MLQFLLVLARRLMSSRSGNATLLMALGMPVLVGGSGLAVDTAMWYMWKRELQFATDQAALAGAWARTQNATEDTYATRARQEFASALQTTDDIVSGPLDVQLANYAGGSNNSVRTEATLSKELPFSGFLTGHGATITVYSQAAFTQGASFTSCIVALDEDDSGAVTIGGSSVLTARCGIASLSTSAQSIVVNGNPQIDAGYVLARGGIDDWFNVYTDDEIHEYMTGLYDPFATLSPPTNITPQTYACTGGTTTYSASVTNRTLVQDIKYSGSKSNQINTVVSTTTVSDTGNISSTEAADKNTKTGTPNGYPATSTVTGSVTSTTTGSGKSAVTTYFRTDRVTTTYKTVNSVGSTTSAVIAAAQPGTYKGGIKVSCTTNFATGIYVIDGGGIDIDGQYSVVGNGVMFVLKNGAYIKINGGSSVNLTAMLASDLVAKGISNTEANKLAGMLVFEDRGSTGTLKNNINGNSSTVLNGTIYLPKSGVDFTGTASVTSQCLMIAANTVKISGNANMSTFCPSGMTEDTVVATEISKVKLVA